MSETILKGACICCGGDIKVTWEDEMSRGFAMAADVCPACWSAGCSGISVIPDDKDRWCNVLNRPSRKISDA